MNTYTDVLSYFLSLGLPEKFVRHVCIDQEDAELITMHIQMKRPKVILEIGSFIGLSTGVIATALEKNSRLVCVDPNLTVYQHRFIGSGEHHHNDTTRSLDYVKGFLQDRAPAQEFVLLSGTFTTPFSPPIYERLMKDGCDPKSIPIIGRDVGVYGPYDMVFLDGDHSTEAVKSDLHTTFEFLSEKGEILLHDISDNWGGDVNLGISLFLQDAQEMQFERLGNNIGKISRKEYQ